MLGRREETFSRNCGIVGRIYGEVRCRPRYVIQETLGPGPEQS